MHTPVQWLHRAELAILNAQATGTIGEETLALILESIRAALLKLEPARLNHAPTPEPPMLSRDGETLLFIQTAVSQWLYGRMMDEDACCSILRIARTSADLWSYLTSPFPVEPKSLWHQALYADARAVFGHLFKPDNSLILNKLYQSLPDA